MRAAVRLALALLAGATAAPSAAQGGDYSYRGWHFDTSALRDAATRAAVLGDVRQQVDIVEQVGLSPATTQVLRGFTITVATGGGGGGHFNHGNVSVDLKPGPDDRPILLHELMHAYMARLLPGGAGNPALQAFFRRAHTPGLWPAGSYMLKNISEYFAMTASTYFYGHAARPPSTRAELEQKQPQYAAWLREQVR